MNIESVINHVRGAMVQIEKPFIKRDGMVEVKRKAFDNNNTLVRFLKSREATKWAGR